MNNRNTPPIRRVYKPRLVYTDEKPKHKGDKTMNTDNGWTRKKALLHNLKASFRAYKNNCQWYMDPKSQWYMKDSKYSKFSAEQFAENNKQYYSEQTLEKDITLNEVYNICFDYFNLQVKGA